MRAHCGPWSGVLAALVHRGADFAAAEDAVQEALIRAVELWPRNWPNDPRGWLITTAWHRFVDTTRSDAARRQRKRGSPTSRHPVRWNRQTTPLPSISCVHTRR